MLGLALPLTEPVTEGALSSLGVAARDIVGGAEAKNRAACPLGGLSDIVPGSALRIVVARFRGRLTPSAFGEGNEGETGEPGAL